MGLNLPSTITCLSKSWKDHVSWRAGSVGLLHLLWRTELEIYDLNFCWCRPQVQVNNAYLFIAPCMITGCAPKLTILLLLGELNLLKRNESKKVLKKTCWNLQHPACTLRHLAKMPKKTDWFFKSSWDSTRLQMEWCLLKLISIQHLTFCTVNHTSTPEAEFVFHLPAIWSALKDCSWQKRGKRKKN